MSRLSYRPCWPHGLPTIQPKIGQRGREGTNIPCVCGCGCGGMPYYRGRPAWVQGWALSGGGPVPEGCLMDVIMTALAPLESVGVGVHVRVSVCVSVCVRVRVCVFVTRNSEVYHHQVFQHMTRRTARTAPVPHSAQTPSHLQHELGLLLPCSQPRRNTWAWVQGAPLRDQTEPDGIGAHGRLEVPVRHVPSAEVKGHPEIVLWIPRVAAEDVPRQTLDQALALATLLHLQ